MAQESIQAPTSARQNVNNPHRIALKSHWEFEDIPAPSGLNFEFLQASRSFHAPTGITDSQVIRFFFQPADSAALVFVGKGNLPLNTINGLASAEITDIMQPTNRVEIRWQWNLIDPSSLREHFTAWIEISDQVPER
jgi:hypothetical protein